jgi:hypothetical protein
MMCFGILVMFCQLPTAAPTDSLCYTYQPIILARGDSAIKANLKVKQRILANELTYRKHCVK